MSALRGDRRGSRAYGLFWRAPIVIALNGAMIASASADVYRCVVDGRVTYADRPCAGASKVHIEAAPPPPVEGRANFQTEASMGRVVVGMPQTQVVQAWGKPKEVSTEKDDKGTTEHWTFVRGSETHDIAIQDGRVTRIISRPYTKPEPQAAQPAAQLTLSELEERERSERAGERKFIRNGTRQEEIRGKLGPPIERRVRATNLGMADCWEYPPTPKDYQTRTTVCYSLDEARVISVDRTIER